MKKVRSQSQILPYKSKKSQLYLFIFFNIFQTLVYSVGDRSRLQAGSPKPAPLFPHTSRVMCAEFGFAVCMVVPGDDADLKVADIVY